MQEMDMKKILFLPSLRLRSLVVHSVNEHELLGDVPATRRMVMFN